LEKTETQPSSAIEFACPDDEVVVVRVKGRGSFQNSASLKAIPGLVHDQYPDVAESGWQYVIDLDECSTMDSTFFGVMASLGLAQIKNKQGKMVLVNVNQHVIKILNTLGLSKIMEVHEAHDAVNDGDSGFQPVNSGELSRVDRVVMMLEAHQQLIDVHDNNEARFRNVVDCLEASLETEKKNAEQE
jgi:anti-anti-sigma factor